MFRFSKNLTKPGCSLGKNLDLFVREKERGNETGNGVRAERKENKEKKTHGGKEKGD
jgi:hypothetical protein